MNKEDFVSFSQACKLKALGFNERVFCRYNKNGKFETNKWAVDDAGYVCADELCYDCNIYDSYCSAPTLAQACKWLRSKGWSVQVYLNGVRTAYFARVWKIEMNSDVVEVKGQFDTYEQAQSAGIDVALGLLEK